MKKEVVFACGCTRKVNINRPSAIAFLQRKTCWVCEKLKFIKDDKFPTLTGSKKQIDWARGIRWEWMGKNLTKKALLKEKIMKHTKASDWICHELNGYFEKKVVTKIGEVGWDE